MELWERMTEHVSPERRKRLEEVVSFRTRFLTVVLEDIYQAQNASAVLRSCECIGVQDVHVIENVNQYQYNPDVVQGSTNWLTLKRWNQHPNNTEDCLQNLKNEGYVIAATSLHDDAVDLRDYDLTKKTALVFGNEKDGISDIVRKNADIFIKIPMFGFTESFNISVSAAICIFQMMNSLRNSDTDWQLPKEERNALLVEWASKNILKSEAVIKRYSEESG